MRPHGRDLLILGFAALLTVFSVTFLVVRSTREPQIVTSPTPAIPTKRPPATPAALTDPSTVGAATTIRPTVVRSGAAADAPERSRLRAGILLPVTGVQGSYVGVMTPCEIPGWVSASDVRLHARAIGDPQTLAQATIVIDPGHGGSLPGAAGPGGMPEKEANQDIALRLARKLAGARVFLTRSGDYTAGLAFRAAIANRLAAHLFVSVHNNAEPDGPSEHPGSETYYQYRSAPSKRLAGLIYEELYGALDAYSTSWVADRDAGAKYRLNTGGTDYYALLRRSSVPAVIVESLFISNPPEEGLLRRPDARETVASAIGTGLRRYVESDDPGSGFTVPYPRPPGPSGRIPGVCRDPNS